MKHIHMLFQSFGFVVRTNTIKKRDRTPYVWRSKRNHLLGQPTIAAPQPTNDQFGEVSYSPTLEPTQPLDLTSPPVIDPAIRKILNYFPPPLEERLLLPPSLKEGFPLPPPLDQLPISPFQANPEPIDWDRLFRLYSSPPTKGIE